MLGLDASGTFGLACVKMRHPAAHRLCCASAHHSQALNGATRFKLRASAVVAFLSAVHLGIFVMYMTVIKNQEKGVDDLNKMGKSTHLSSLV